MTYRILVADDEEDLRFMLELHLGREGYEVLSVADGQSALDALTHQSFDFALCDLVMPKLTGLEVIAALKESEVQTPVVLMSAHADVDTALKAIELGAFDYIAKPFRADEVLFRLRRAVEQKALEVRVDQLEDALGERLEFNGIIAQSQKMQDVFRTIKKVADYRTTVLLTGESGTGKELVAKALHFSSVRKRQPFVAVNCGAIPESLLETELFGHVRGAFTDANRDRRGLFEEASGGTLFLDEIGELPLPLQIKLLRVLQENEIRRVGDSRNIKVDVRIVAATVRDLVTEVSEGQFREDLFYRLNVLPIRLPALRERPTDIPLLVTHFLGKFNEVMGTCVTEPSPETSKLLQTYAWPGNVRELENTIERAIVLCDGQKIVADDLPERVRSSEDRIRSVLSTDELSIKKTTRIIEEELIKRALDQTSGNRTHAAELLEISHRALLYKIKQYEINHPPRGQR
jgi:two-component system, NtrC family, response regulator AtoC